ncbi:MAG: type 4a pilus biogenesis protein PilO [Bacteriovoracia bacterium]
MEQLKNILAKIPWIPALLLYLGVYIGYFGYYTFMNDPTQSEYLQKQADVERIRNDNIGLEKKAQDAEDFYRKLEEKRTEIRALATQLGEMKTTLSEELDVASFVKMVDTEAKKVGLRIGGIRPAGEKKSQDEFYFENTFVVAFKGIYAQVVVFLERLSKVNRIVRVDELNVEPVNKSGLSVGRFVELQGDLKIKVYRYNASKADEVARTAQTATSSGAATSPAGGSR